MNRSLMIAALAATLCATSAFALEPRQPSGQAGVENLAAFQKWVKTKQPAHVIATARSCKVPVWSASCGKGPDSGFQGYSDHEGGGNGGGGKDSGK